MYNAHPCFWPELLEKKSFHFNFLNSIIYLYLETKPITVFQGIMLHNNIIIAF